MGIYRFDNKYASPTRAQRERYMTGECEEHCIGPEGEIMVILYASAAYVKDEIDGTRILLTGEEDKEKVQDEVNGLVESHRQRENRRDSFATGGEI
ncbi:MAG: hypothetical protein EHJ95_03665 [Methanobacteriota archaeon]|nr:MAG: hypothetical protein EHJ95_03665 [Euryarchaeota archaeon]